MKLLTTIQPRSNDTVTYTDMSKGAKNARTYVFARDAETGELVCDIEDDEVVGKLLFAGDFEPLHEEDHERADELCAEQEAKASAEAQRSGRSAGGKVVSAGADDTFTETVNGGLPVEANTTPVPRKSPQARMVRGARGGKRTAMGG